MTLITSFKNSFKKGMSVFLWTLKSSKATIIVYISLLALSCVSNFMINAGLNGLLSGEIPVQVSKNMAALPMASQMWDALLLALVFAFVLSLQGFGYLHNKRKTDMFGALPVSRRTLFFSKMFSAIVISVVPMMIVMFSLNIIYSGSSVAEYCNAGHTIDALVCVIANVSLFGLLSVCCGKTSDTIISAIVINCAYPVTMFMLQLLPASLVFGYVPNLNTDIIFALCPISSAFTLSFVYWLIFSLLCIVVSFFLVKRRKAEAAQSHFAYKLPFVAVKLLVSFASGIMFAYLFSLLLGVGSTVAQGYLYFWLGMILGSLTAYVVIQIILAHGVKGFFRGLIPYGGMIAAFALIFIVIAEGMFGYESYVPKAEEIKSVKVGNEQPLVIGTKTVCDFTSEDRGFIEETVKAHQQAINFNEKHEKSIYSLSAANLSTTLARVAGSVINDTNNDNFSLTYTLKNGSTVTRDYRLNDYKLYTELKDYFESEEYLKNTSYLFSCDDNYCCAAEVFDLRENSNNNYDCTVYRTEIFDAKFLDELMPAIRKDMMASDMQSDEYNTGEDGLQITFYYHDMKEFYKQRNSDSFSYPSTSQTVLVNESFKNTMKVFEKHREYISGGEYMG